MSSGSMHNRPRPPKGLPEDPKTTEASKVRVSFVHQRKKLAAIRLEPASASPCTLHSLRGVQLCCRALHNQMFRGHTFVESPVVPAMATFFRSNWLLQHVTTMLDACSKLHSVTVALRSCKSSRKSATRCCDEWQRSRQMTSR